MTYRTAMRKSSQPMDYIKRAEHEIPTFPTVQPATRCYTRSFYDTVSKQQKCTREAAQDKYPFLLVDQASLDLTSPVIHSRGLFLVPVCHIKESEQCTDTRYAVGSSEERCLARAILSIADMDHEGTWEIRWDHDSFLTCRVNADKTITLDYTYDEDAVNNNSKQDKFDTIYRILSHQRLKVSTSSLPKETPESRGGNFVPVEHAPIKTQLAEQYVTNTVDGMCINGLRVPLDLDQRLGDSAPVPRVNWSGFESAAPTHPSRRWLPPKELALVLSGEKPFCANHLVDGKVSSCAGYVSFANNHGFLPEWLGKLPYGKSHADMQHRECLVEVKSGPNGPEILEEAPDCSNLEPYQLKVMDEYSSRARCILTIYQYVQEGKLAQLDDDHFPSLSFKQMDGKLWCEFKERTALVFAETAAAALTSQGADSEELGSGAGAQPAAASPPRAASAGGSEQSGEEPDDTALKQAFLTRYQAARSCWADFFNSGAMWHRNPSSNMQEISSYANDHPNSTTARVYNELVEEQQEQEEAAQQHSQPQPLQ